MALFCIVRITERMVQLIKAVEEAGNGNILSYTYCSTVDIKHITENL
jgi:hypothetical protein